LRYRDFAFRAARIIAGAALLAAAASPQARAASPTCDAPLDIVRLAKPLPRLAQKLASGAPITIVAIGSSSTEGAGASSPAATYPSRLQDELGQRFRGHSFRVINQGVGGEEIGDMLKRFDKAVIAAKPDLVLWQLGTNSVLRDHAIGDHGAAIRDGLRKIRAIGADVVLIDPQFSPKVIAKPEAPRMVALIALTAKQEDVDLFPRYDMMRRWRDVNRMDFKVFVSADGLHMNDWSYACWAKGLTVAIGEAATRPLVAAAASPFAD
jgi:lysophospholipase L1-like esterase